MKKLILLTIAVTFMATSMVGQSGSEDTRAQFQFGLKAGTNYANVYDERGEEFRADGKFGFVGGVFMTIPIGKGFGIQPEILFSQKGFKAEGSFLGSNYGLTRTTNFIDVPLYVAIKPISAVTIMAGPQFSYLLRQKDQFRSAGGTFEYIEEFENDNIRKNILGLAGGIDVNVNHLVIGARAGWDLSTNNGDGSSQTPRYKNAWLQATLGYRFL
ncbi:MAG: PorT family protein [Saprospirales bacterium]|nr:MAG: PorT family protein [Saprospirales bacterium]